MGRHLNASTNTSQVTSISVTPYEFSLQLQAMTKEKLKVCLPVVFTIGPGDDPDSLAKYAVLLTGSADAESGKSSGKEGRSSIARIVEGIIEGETRSVVSNLTMAELFEHRSAYRKNVVETVQSELAQFGLFIYNASIKELQDMPGSQYFEFQSKKAHEGVQSQARVDVANAKREGEIGEAQHLGKTKQEIAKINAQTALLETERKIEKAQADSKLKSQEIDIEQKLNIERIQAERAAELKDAELQKGVQERRALMELEKQRATTVTKAKVAKESAAEDADAQLYKQQKDAEAKAYTAAKEADVLLYRAQKEADGFYKTKEREVEAKTLQETKSAEMALYRAEKEAQGTLELRRCEAEALYISREREAAGLEKLAVAYGRLGEVLGGPQGVMQYLMLEKEQYVKLAHENAEGFRGLQPQVHMWTTGAQEGNNNAFGALAEAYRSFAPTFQTVQEQTGMRPPEWMAQLAPPMEQQKRGDLGKDFAKSDKFKGINGA